MNFDAIAGGNHLGTVGGNSANECAWHCQSHFAITGGVISAGFMSQPPCKFFSWSSGSADSLSIQGKQIFISPRNLFYIHENARLQRMLVIR